MQRLSLGVAATASARRSRASSTTPGSAGRRQARREPRRLPAEARAGGRRSASDSCVTSAGAGRHADLRRSGSTCAQLQRAARRALDVVAMRDRHAEESRDAGAVAGARNGRRSARRPRRPRPANRSLAACACSGSESLRRSARIRPTTTATSRSSGCAVVRGGTFRSSCVGGVRRCRSNLVAQLHRLRLGARVQLAGQQVPAQLELPQRRDVPTLFHIEVHRARDGHDFLKRIERQQPQRRVDCTRSMRPLSVCRASSRDQRVHGALAELVAARRQPVVVRRLARVDCLHRNSPTYSAGRALQRGVAAVVVDEPLERERVDVDAAGGQLEGLRGPGDQLVRRRGPSVRRSTRSAWRRLARACRSRAVAPQQRGELGARRARDPAGARGRRAAPAPSSPAEAAAVGGSDREDLQSTEQLRILSLGHRVDHRSCGRFDETLTPTRRSR